EGGPSRPESEAPADPAGATAMTGCTRQIDAAVEHQLTCDDAGDGTALPRVGSHGSPDHERTAGLIRRLDAQRRVALDHHAMGDDLSIAGKRQRRSRAQS